MANMLDILTDDISKPEAHDNINSLISDADTEFIMNLVMGVAGGGPIKKLFTGPFNPAHLLPYSKSYGKNKGLQALLPLLLAQMAKNYPMLEPLQGDVPNIGRPPKQY